MGFGVFGVFTYPIKGCVAAEKRTGVCGSILGKARPHLGKMSPSGQFVRKMGKCALELGEKKSIMI